MKEHLSREEAEELMKENEHSLTKWSGLRSYTQLIWQRAYKAGKDAASADTWLTKEP